MNGWRACGTADGSWTLVHPGHGQACHSSAGALTQARERYARECRLPERARRGEHLCLLDVGTGLGLNLAAALEAFEGTRGALDCVSLEQDAEVIAAALGEAGTRGAACAAHARVLTGLEQAARSPGAGLRLAERVTLTWIPGDARVTLPALDAAGAAGRAFDAVFLDPFSPGVDSELWEPAFLAAVAARMARGAWLSTYSASFRVRLALARAGLRVGRGARVGAKAEGTLASPDLEPPPLAGRTARRLARSGRAFSGLGADSPPRMT